VNADVRILVVTVVHHPLDSRIWFRQINALLANGCDVTFAAPYSGFGVALPAERPATPRSGALRCVDVTRSSGRHRIGAAAGARRLIRNEGAKHDLVLLHDPELLLAVAGLRTPNIVWDVHEDVSAALGVKGWVPRALRPIAAWLWRRFEGMVEGRYRLLLAEPAYQLRFKRPHPVVPNTVTVPADVVEPGRDRVIYIGSITRARGCTTMIEVGSELRRRTGGAMRVDIVGDAPDPVAADELQLAHARGDVVWHGYLPSDVALNLARGALAGLCLLEDLPNFRVSMPTKVVEYCAMALPVIVTPLPLAVELVRRAESGVVVPWHDPVAVADAVLMLRDDPELARKLGRNGYREAAEHHDWRVWSGSFAAIITSWASEARTSAPDQGHPQSSSPERAPTP
jgi:glycosyltransferase involved in cell wall biosynthesis